MTLIVKVGEENMCNKSQDFSHTSTKTQNIPGTTDQQFYWKEFVVIYQTQRPCLTAFWNTEKKVENM